jgi:hypothetical protein
MASTGGVELLPHKVGFNRTHLGLPRRALSRSGEPSGERAAASGQRSAAQSALVHEGFVARESDTRIPWA